MKLPYSLMEGEPGAAGGAPVTASAAPTSPTPASEAQEVNWGELSSADDFDGEDPPPTPPATPPETPTPPATQPQPAAPVQPAVQPAQPPSPAPQPPAAQPGDQETQAAEARKALHAELTGIYTRELTEDQKAALIGDPASVMPAMLAQAALDGAQLALRQITAVLPHVVQHTTSQQQMSAKAWDEFLTAHPDLAKPEQRKAVMRAVENLKASGSVAGLSKEQVMARTARLARAMLGMDEPTAAAPAPAGTPTPEPGAPAAPFVPVGRNRAASPAPAKDKSIWAEMSEPD